MKHTCRRWLVAGFLTFAAVGAWAQDPWILIDLRQRTLSLREGDKVLLHFDNIAVGRSGAAIVHRRGDNKTPIGRYQIGWLNPNSRFHRFMGINYPTELHARVALAEQIIDNRTYQSIADAYFQGRVPPQNTPLGGHIGIHGMGDKTMSFHKSTDWTEGCVAITNAQIEILFKHVEVGTEVVIR